MKSYTVKNLSELRAFLNDEKMILAGYNNKNYDQWILKTIIYYGEEPEKVKEANDWIIKSGQQGWEHPLIKNIWEKLLYSQVDLMDDLGTQVFLRLKEIEGNLGLSIEESKISFDIDRPLTEAELKESINYCMYDVRAAGELLKKRMSYLKNKIAVGEMGGISLEESLKLTNPKLTSKYLKAKKKKYDDEFVYEFPDNLKINNYTHILEFYKEVDYKKKLETDIAGVPHILAWGGLHGAIKHYQAESTKDFKIVHIDVTSYYPSLMIQNGYLSRSVPDPEAYKEVFNKRIEAKNSGDKTTADALKLILNSTYGAMKEKFNNLYDPKMANHVCISGQLYLVDLIEKLEYVDSFKLIQSNTDGLIIGFESSREERIRTIIKSWEERTNFQMGWEKVKKIVQKDVNNYILLNAYGKVEVKGAYVTNYHGGDFQTNSLIIVQEAIVNYFLYGTTPELTINDCSELEKFQIICKAGSTYDYVEWERGRNLIQVQNVNRVFATEDDFYGTLKKVKIEQDRKDKIANLPEKCKIINYSPADIEDPQTLRLDRQWYIDLAQKRINDYLGIKPEKVKKERKKKMATAKKVSGLNEKLMMLRDVLNKCEWEKTGKNKNQGYKYIPESQYKNNFKKALSEAGLDFKCNELEAEFLGSISDKMNMVKVKYEYLIKDPETGESEIYTNSGMGADMGDKGIYKAATGAFKYFVANNFLVAENMDPENDEEDIKPKYTSPEAREEVKQEIKKTKKEPATEEQLESIYMGLDMLEEAGENEAAEEIRKELKKKLTKEQAEEIIEALGELIDDNDAA
ncbi:ERF family protein [Selenomonadales bacterium OttesenSCG-928-I06]|nr:ERF family protein [Selenomonadales bacterium OttesenSCG-928-I06]